jgi:hypothetical protein
MAEELNAGELAALLGKERTCVEVAGTALEVRPLNLSQIADVLQVLDRMGEQGTNLVMAVGGARRDFDPVRMLLRGGADALELLAIAACDPKEYIANSVAARQMMFSFVRGLDFNEGAKLFSTVYRVNSDFFHRNRTTILETLAPVLGDVAALVDVIVLKAAALLSRMQSNSSSATDTDSKTSAATASDS